MLDCHCDLGCEGYRFTVRWHSELSNAVEGFWNPVSFESIAPEAIEMFGLVWTRRYEVPETLKGDTSRNGSQRTLRCCFSNYVAHF